MFTYEFLLRRYSRTLHVKILDTEVAQVLSDRLKRYGFELRKELWSSNSAGMGVFLRNA